MSEKPKEAYDELKKEEDKDINNKVNKKIKFCRNCGQEISENDIFCMNCGCKCLYDKKTSEKNNNKSFKDDIEKNKFPKKNFKEFILRKKKLIGVLIGALLIISGILFFIMFKLQSPSNFIEVTKENIEAGENISVNDFVEIKDKYKDNYSIKPKQDKYNFKTLGEISIPYIVTDNNGEEKEVDCTFNVVDTTAPEINTSKDLTIKKGSDFDISKFVSIKDNLDGDIDIKNLNIENGNVNTKEEGEYTLTLSVTDSNGNKNKKEVTFIVKEEISVDDVMQTLLGLWLPTEYASMYSETGVTGDAMILYVKEGSKYYQKGYESSAEITIKSIQEGGRIIEYDLAGFEGINSYSSHVTIDMGLTGDNMININGVSYTWVGSGY